MAIETINPATGRLIQSYAEHSRPEVSRVLDDVSGAFASWRDTEFGTRSALFEGMARLLRERQESLAALMATEVGKPLREGRAEVGKSGRAALRRDDREARRTLRHVGTGDHLHVSLAEEAPGIGEYRSLPLVHTVDMGSATERASYRKFTVVAALDGEFAVRSTPVDTRVRDPGRVAEELLACVGDPSTLATLGFTIYVSDDGVARRWWAGPSADRECVRHAATTDGQDGIGLQ